jgi:hypothetical protein
MRSFAAIDKWAKELKDTYIYIITLSKIIQEGNFIISKKLGDVMTYLLEVTFHPGSLQDYLYKFLNFML